MPTGKDLLTIAAKEIGVHETPGPKSTERIVEYDSTTTLKATDDSVPWCSSFVNWVVIKAGGEGTNSAAAVSWLGWGTRIEHSNPLKPGDVIVFRWSDGGHHVCFFTKDLGDYIKCLGGNQADQVKYSLYPKRKIMGVRRVT